MAQRRYLSSAQFLLSWFVLKCLSIWKAATVLCVLGLLDMVTWTWLCAEWVTFALTAFELVVMQFYMSAMQ